MAQNVADEEVISDGDSYPASPGTTSLQSHSANESEDESEHQFESKEHVTRLVSQMNKFRESEEFCDVVLIVEKTRFPAHRHALAAASDYYKSMFSSNFREKFAKEVEIKSIDKDTFSLVLNFMYTGSIDIYDDNFDDIFRAANMFLLDDLVQICERYGEDFMNESNCVARWKIAEELNNSNLENVVYYFIRDNFAELVDNEDMYTVSPALVREILGSPDLNIGSEEFACQFAVRYIEENKENIGNDVVSVITSLRLEMLDPSYIKTHLLDNNTIRRTPSLIKYLQAVHDHLAYNNALPEDFVYRESRLQPTPPCGIYLFGGKPSISADNNCQCILQEQEGMVHTKNVATMPKGKCEFAASCSYRGDIYISGIGSRVDELWKYVTTLNQWLRCAKMWSPRCRHVMVNGTPNLLYVLGGATGYELADRNGHGGDPPNLHIGEYNTNIGRWRNRGVIMKSVLHPSAVYWSGVIYIIGGAQKRGRDFMKIIQKYDPSTETTVILSVSLPISVNCPKAILVRRTAVILGFHQSVAIDMDGLDAVHAVNTSQQSEGAECTDPSDKPQDVLESAAECMTIRKGAKVAWFGAEFLGKELFVIGGQNIDNLSEDKVKKVDIEEFLSDDSEEQERVEWVTVGTLQQKQRFCTVTGLGYYNYWLRTDM